MKYRWLIEAGSFAAPVYFYFTGLEDPELCIGVTFDPNRALALETREVAEVFRQLFTKDPTDFRVCEHGFMLADPK